MRPRQQVERALAAHESGSTASAIARDLGIPRETIRDWLASTPALLLERREEHHDATCSTRSGLTADYAMVLGLYLGDGCLSQQANGVWKLRIVGDARYPDLLDEWALAIASVIPRRVGRVAREGCVELTSHSKHWRCLLPQHGSGVKHDRRIELEDWQRPIVARHAGPFLRGLFFSDGCRVVNRIRGKYEYGRYFFSNRSDDIRAIALATLEAIGITPTQSNQWNLSVARRDDVAFLDELIGFKH